MCYATFLSDTVDYLTDTNSISRHQGLPPLVKACQAPRLLNLPACPVSSGSQL